MGPVATPADQRGRQSSWRGGGSPKLEDMEKAPRPPVHLQDDPGAHGIWHVRRVPQENRTGDDGHLSLLQGGQGHSTAHAGALPGTAGSYTPCGTS